MNLLRWFKIKDENSQNLRNQIAWLEMEKRYYQSQARELGLWKQEATRRIDDLQKALDKKMRVK